MYLQIDFKNIDLKWYIDLMIDLRNPIGFYEIKCYNLTDDLNERDYIIFSNINGWYINQSLLDYLRKKEGKEEKEMHDYMFYRFLDNAAIEILKRLKK